MIGVFYAMKLSPLFKLRLEAPESLVRLLTSVTLGTNGAKYKHLDTVQRIKDADAPVHLCMERHENVIGNVTFCRREKYWYVRYFAVDRLLQGKGKQKSKSRSGSLKQQLNSFFDTVIQEGCEHGQAESFYAYIDPNNEKSLWMSENFHFQTIGHVATQSFSRTQIPRATRVQKTSDWETVAALIKSSHQEQQFYFDAQLKKGPFYVLRDATGEVVACAKAIPANWKIERLPGKMGGLLTKVIPFVPGLRKVIRPKHHRFLVPEGVFVKDNNPELLKTLFEGMLSIEQRNLILWWTDVRNPVYVSTKNAVRWGVLHRLIGAHQVAIVVRTVDGAVPDKTTPVYTCGFDFV